MRLIALPAIVLGALSLLTVRPCAASAVFVINYTGLVTQGNIRVIDQNQTSFQVDLDAGATISGNLIFALDLSPAAVVTPIGGLTEVQLTDTGSAFTWIGGSMNLQLPMLPPNLLPIPSAFTLDRSLPPASGVYDTAPTVSQSLRFTYNADGLFNVTAIANFADSWSIPGTQRTLANEFVGLSVNSIDSYVPFDGLIPYSFAAPNASGGSSFSFVGFARDLPGTTPPLFGITQNYSLLGTFQTTSANGQLLLTPEPGTWLAGLALLATITRAGRARFSLPAVERSSLRRRSFLISIARRTALRGPRCRASAARSPN